MHSLLNLISMIFISTTYDILGISKMLKPGVIDLENDQVTRAIDKLMQGLLENIKYKKQNKEKE